MGSYAPLVLHGRMAKAVVSSHKRWYQLINVLEGGYELRCNGASYRGEPGSVFVVPPGASCAYVAHQDSRSCLLACTVRAASIHRSGPKKQTMVLDDSETMQPTPAEVWACDLPVQLPKVLAKQVSSSIVFIAASWWRNDQQHFIANQRLCYVFERVAAHFHTTAEPTRPTKGMGTIIYELIHQHYVNLHTTEDIADRLGLSVSHVNQQFKKYTGKTPAAVLREFRLEETARLLAGSLMKLSAVASLVGFRNAKALHRAWLQQYGCTPTQWRRQQMGYSSLLKTSREEEP